MRATKNINHHKSQSNVLFWAGLLASGLFLFCLAGQTTLAATPTGTATLPPGSNVPASNNPSVSGCGSFVATGDYCLLTGKLGTYFTDGKIHIRSGGLSMYLDTMYKIGVGVATGLALIFITIGGVQYASTDSITGTEHGKQTIQNALLGLLLVLGSYIMLNAINPNLLKNSLKLNSVGGVTPTSADVNPSGLEMVQTTISGAVGGVTATAK